MVMKCHTRTGILSLLLGFALLLGTVATGAMAQKTAGKKCQVAVGLEKKSVTKEQMAREIRQQLTGCGVSASEQEVQAATQQSLNLVGKAKDPQKGIIYIPAKKFTICVSWGRHKSFCDTH